MNVSIDNSTLNEDSNSVGASSHPQVENSDDDPVLLTHDEAINTLNNENEKLNGVIAQLKKNVVEITLNNKELKAKNVSLQEVINNLELRLSQGRF